VRRLRQEIGYTQSDLAANLKANGHPIPLTSIGRIEGGERRVEVDDLVALAAALGVSPLAVLLPHTRAAGDEAPITGWTRATALEVWRWALGGVLIPERDDDRDERDLYLNVRRSFPWWLEPGDPQQTPPDRGLWLIKRDPTGPDDDGGAYVAPEPRES
jgi:transcriptional regulator with XRE-family HTH domain